MAQHPTWFWPLARDGWDAFKASPWPILAASTSLLAGMGILAGSAIVFEELAQQHQLGRGARAAVDVVAPTVLAVFFQAAWLVALHIALRTLRRQRPEWSSALALLGQSLVVNALAQAVALLGFLACVVPGFIAGVGLAYGQWFLVDRSLGPLAALSASWEATRGHRMGVFWLTLLLGCLLLLGVFAAPLVLALLLLMGASSHEQLARRVFTPRGLPDGESPPSAHEAPAPPVPVGLWIVGVLASLVALALWDPETIRWLFPALSDALPSLDDRQIQAAIAGAIVAPALVVLVVGLRIHTRHRAIALDARGVWLDATPRDGRLVPWRDVARFDVLADGVRLELRGLWSALGPVVQLDEARRPEAVALLEAHGVRRREG